MNTADMPALPLVIADKFGLVIFNFSAASVMFTYSTSFISPSSNRKTNR